jgi:hypothetical protein
MLTAFWQEALGLQVIERPAARTLDLQFKVAAGRGELAATVAASDVLHTLLSPNPM